MEQLQMLLSERMLTSPPNVAMPEGYELRTFQPEDKTAYIALVNEAGLDFTEQMLESWLLKVLPDGLFLAIHMPAGEVAATAMAAHNPSDKHPFGGELGWAAASPRHSGKGLGKAVCAAATARFIQAGYRRIYLKTDDWRLPAIRIYLKLGYEPFLYMQDMEERWRVICEKLKQPFTPGKWPKVKFS